MQSSSRKDILKRIASATQRRLAFVEKPSDYKNIYKPILPDIITCFKNELEAINGQCILCESEFDLYLKIKELILSKGISYVFCRDSRISISLKSNDIPTSSEIVDFENMQAGITACEFLIARTGSVVVSSKSESGRQMNIFPPVHIVIAHASQLVEYPEDAYIAIQKKYRDTLPSSISTISGPSRTADIEKTLVLGAHGPKEFIVFLYKE
ncbi:MAG: LUD domain-containing protein [Paludibacter sp.]|nr:LUD domain-containing protein [Paludibacter sp.]